MNKKEVNKMNNEKKAFLENTFVFGLVIRASLKDINQIKEFIADTTDSYVIYQKISANRLWIKEGEKDE